MGFLERINNAVQFNISGKSSSNKSYFGFGFNSNALKKYDLNNDVFTNTKYATKVNSNDNSLALNQPVAFIRQYLNPTTIQKAVENNPNISRILSEYGLECKFNFKNVESIMMSHLIPTSKNAQKIYLKMGHKKEENNYLYLTQAALLHDIGKGFIPEEILNKAGKLNSKEREIVQLHNRLSYEILKTTDLNPRVAQLTLEHHDYNKNLKRNDENQAITIADVYCALKENRPYKKPLSDLLARTVLYDMGTKGSFDTRYVSYAC